MMEIAAVRQCDAALGVVRARHLRGAHEAPAQKRLIFARMNVI
jgi:septum formation inhibitor-activating ATPase MinD